MAGAPTTNASAFGCDPQAAARLSDQLSGIRQSMVDTVNGIRAFGGATGSQRVEEALDRFFTQSSERRKTTVEALERAAGLLRMLAEGTAAVDAELSAGLPSSAAAVERRP
jgi:hypothetical protein